MSLSDDDLKPRVPVLKSLGKEFEVTAKEKLWPRPYPLFFVVTGLSAPTAIRYGSGEFKNLKDALAALEIKQYTDSWSSEEFAEQRRIVEGSWKAYEASAALWKKWDKSETKVRRPHCRLLLLSLDP